MKIIVENKTTVTANSHWMEYRYENKTTNIRECPNTYGYSENVDLDLKSANDLLEFLMKLKDLELI